MTAREQHHPTEQQALELLPWYVNGTLADSERELVRRALLFSLTCRKEFERLRRLQQAMQRDDAESAATERAFERLLARIDHSAVSRPPRRGNARHRVVWPYLAQAALLLALISGLVWWWVPEPATPPRSYGTLSAPQPAQADVSLLRVVFAPGLSSAALRELLAEHRLTIVDGPTRDGLYSLAPAEGADLRLVVAALKADPRVVFTSTPAAAEVR
jgi:hypothetical protein